MISHGVHMCASPPLPLTLSFDRPSVSCRLVGRALSSGAVTCPGGFTGHRLFPHHVHVWRRALLIPGACRAPFPPACPPHTASVNEPHLPCANERAVPRQGRRCTLPCCCASQRPAASFEGGTFRSRAAVLSAAAGAGAGQVIKRTQKRAIQQYIDTTDGQRMQWPPKALQVGHARPRRPSPAGRWAARHCTRTPFTAHCRDQRGRKPLASSLPGCNPRIAGGGACSAGFQQPHPAAAVRCCLLVPPPPLARAGHASPPSQRHPADHLHCSISTTVVHRRGNWIRPRRRRWSRWGPRRWPPYSPTCPRPSPPPPPLSPPAETQAQPKPAGARVLLACSTTRRHDSTCLRQAVHPTNM